MQLLQDDSQYFRSYGQKSESRYSSLCKTGKTAVGIQRVKNLTKTLQKVEDFLKVKSTKRYEVLLR